MAPPVSSARAFIRYRLPCHQNASSSGVTLDVALVVISSPSSSASRFFIVPPSSCCRRPAARAPVSLAAGRCKRVAAALLGGRAALNRARGRVDDRIGGAGVGENLGGVPDGRERGLVPGPRRRP